MPHLIAEKAFPYAGRSLKPGDRFEASDKDMRVLKAGRLAKDDQAADETKRSRRYQRRDMIAEG